MSNISGENLSYWLKSVLFTLAQRFSVMIVGIGAFLVLVRVLDKAEMGIYALFFTIITIFEVTRDGLIKNGLIRFINISNKIDNAKIQSAALILSFGYTLIFVCIILFSAKPLSIYWDSPQLAEMLYIYIFTAITSIFFSHTEYIQQANFFFKGIFLIYFIKQGVYFLFILISVFLLKETSLIKLATLQALSILIATTLGLLIAKKFLPRKFILSPKWINEQWKYGKFVLATNISSQALRTVDHFLLASLISTQAVALYNTSVRIANLLDMPSKAVAEALFPKSVKKAEDENDYIANLYSQTTGSIIAVLIPVCLFIYLFPDLIIRIVAGEKYLDAVPLLRVAVLYSLLLPFQKQFGTVIDASGKPRINFIVNLILALFNLVIVYILVITFGSVGAAYGLLITLILAFAITQTILRKEINVNTLKAFKHVFLIYTKVFSSLKIK